MAANTDAVRHVALITGGAAGLGWSFAVALASTQTAEAICLIDLHNASSQAKILHEMFPHVRVIGLECDVTNTESLFGAFQSAEAALGSLTLVANNAGIASSGFEDVKLTIDVNVTAVIQGTKIAYEMMSKSGVSGVIVNIGSLAGLIAVPFTPVYAASKAAVVHFSKSCAYMAAGGGASSCGEGTARVFALCPGFADTAMVQAGIAMQDSGLVQAVEFQGGVLTPEFVADCFLELVLNDSLAPGGYMMVIPQKVTFGRKTVTVPIRVSGAGRVKQSVSKL